MKRQLLQLKIYTWGLHCALGFFFLHLIDSPVINMYTLALKNCCRIFFTFIILCGFLKFNVVEIAPTSGRYLTVETVSTARNLVADKKKQQQHKKTPRFQL